MLGTHNSWSFCKPTNRLLRPFWFTAKCQDDNIQKQYSQGSRIFDLRVWFNKKGHVEIRHGVMSFKTNYMKDLEWLDGKGDCYVRVIFESNKQPDKLNERIERFTHFCSLLETTFVNIKFFGGRTKWNWKTVYVFNTTEIPLLDRYSSTTSMFNNGKHKIVDDWYPRIYAKKFNKKNYQQYISDITEKRHLFVDFIHYCFE